MKQADPMNKKKTGRWYQTARGNLPLTEKRFFFKKKHELIPA